MKLFVAYGYNARDRWVAELVIPLAQAFRLDVITGEQTYLGTIPQVVLQRVQAADAVLAFTTRRDPMPNGVWTTHHWVLQEMAAAMAHNRPVIEVREVGLDPQAAMQQGRQSITFDENNRELCLLQIAQALGDLRFSAMEVQILPPTQDWELIGPLARSGGLQCSYTFKDGAYKSPPNPVEVDAIKGGLFISIRGVPSSALIKISLQAAGRTWSSDYDSVKSSIQLI